LVGAPNSAPSLCSVAGLLLALALQSGYEDPSPSFPLDLEVQRRDAPHECRAIFRDARQRAERSSAVPCKSCRGAEHPHGPTARGHLKILDKEASGVLVADVLA